jgi:hypothetical protein
VSGDLRHSSSPLIYICWQNHPFRPNVVAFFAFYSFVYLHFASGTRPLRFVRIYT